MGRDRSRSNRRTAVPFLPRHFFDRKECAEHGLLAIEVELVGADEIPIDAIATPCAAELTALELSDTVSGLRSSI